jgi:hypothetical protein
MPREQLIELFNGLGWKVRLSEPATTQGSKP